MEIRKAKIIKSSAGGTVAKNAVTYKISLPTAWINELGIDKDSREVELYFDGMTITIGKKQAAESFISLHKKLGHRVKFHGRRCFCLYNICNILFYSSA